MRIIDISEICSGSKVVTEKNGRETYLENAIMLGSVSNVYNLTRIIIFNSATKSLSLIPTKSVKDHK